VPSLRFALRPGKAGKRGRLTRREKERGEKGEAKVSPPLNPPRDRKFGTYLHPFCTPFLPAPKNERTKFGADSCSSDGDLCVFSGISRRKGHARLIVLWPQSCSVCVCLCVCVCVCLCVHRRPHTNPAAGSAPGSKRFGHIPVEEELEIRRREPPGVCRIRGVNELGAPGSRDRPPLSLPRATVE
jgi:hypothetical protein